MKRGMRMFSGKALRGGDLQRKDLRRKDVQRRALQDRALRGKELCRGSFTVEGSILIPMFLLMLLMAISLGIDFYTDLSGNQKSQPAEGMWEVSDFYMYEGIGELTDD